MEKILVMQIQRRKQIGKEYKNTFSYFIEVTIPIGIRIITNCMFFKRHLLRYRTLLPKNCDVRLLFSIKIYFDNSIIFYSELSNFVFKLYRTKNK